MKQCIKVVGCCVTIEVYMLRVTTKLCLLLFCIQSFAQLNFNEIEGTITLKPGASPATDLTATEDYTFQSGEQIKKGQLLSEAKAFKLFLEKNHLWQPEALDYLIQNLKKINPEEVEEKDKEYYFQLVKDLQLEKQMPRGKFSPTALLEAGKELDQILQKGTGKKSFKKLVQSLPIEQSKFEYRWSFAELEPSEKDQIYWKNQMGGLPETQKTDFQELAKKGFSFNGREASPKGSYYLLGKNSQTKKDYTVVFDTLVHNILAKKVLLHKLGYTVPEMAYIPSTKVYFDSREELCAVKDDIGDSSVYTTLPWVVSVNGFSTAEDESILDKFCESELTEQGRYYSFPYTGQEYWFEVKDVVVYESHDNEYQNIANLNFINKKFHNDKRVFKSLLIPSALLNIPESLKKFPWLSGRVTAGFFTFNEFPNASQFNCSYEDAVWILKRMAQLTKQDWVEIAQATNFTQQKVEILVQQLLSRVQHLYRVFNINYLPIDIDHDHAAHLLADLPETTPYSARRDDDDQADFPLLAPSQMRSFFGSKIISMGLDYLVQGVNNLKYMGTDIDAKLNEIQESYQEDYINAAATGDPKKTNVFAKAFPFVGGKLIISRDLQAGGFLDYGSQVNLVDTFGFSLNGGMLAGLYGIETATGKTTQKWLPDANGEYTIKDGLGKELIPVNVSMNAQAGVTMTYAHVKPVESVKKALKYGFHNIFVPMLKARYAKPLKALKKEDFVQASLGEKEEKIKEVMDTLNERLKVGESLIITRSLNLGAGVNVSYNLYNIVDLSAGLGVDGQIISRLHITRPTKDSIHIYNDLGAMGGVQLILGIEKYVPIMKVAFRAAKGWARVHYYNLDIGDAEQRDYQYKSQHGENLLALRKVFLSEGVGAVKKLQKPYKLKHKITEKSINLGIFSFRYKNLKSSNVISLTPPEGETQEFYRYSKGHLTGFDNESYVQDLVGAVYGKLTDQNMGGLTLVGGNPGYTYYGKGKAKVISLEASLDSRKKLYEPYVKIARVWNAWSMKKKKVENVLAQIYCLYHNRFTSFKACVTNAVEAKEYGPFEESVLMQTERMLLPNIQMNLSFHSGAIDYILNEERLDEKAVQSIFLNQGRRELPTFTSEEAYQQTGAVRFLNLREKLRKAYAEKSFKKVGKIIVQLFDHVDEELNLEGLKLIVGGEENFYSFSQIGGFRMGDPRGDEPIISDAVGTEPYLNELIDNQMQTVQGYADRTNQEITPDSVIDNMMGQVGNPEILGPFRRVISRTKMNAGEFYISWFQGRLL